MADSTQDESAIKQGVQNTLHYEHSLDWFAALHPVLSNMLRIDPKFRFHRKFEEVVQLFVREDHISQQMLHMERNNPNPSIIIDKIITAVPDTPEMEKLKAERQKYKDEAQKIFDERSNTA